MCRVLAGVAMLLCPLLLTGCATKAVVPKPYTDVCRGMTRMAEQINQSPPNTTVKYDLQPNLDRERHYPFARLVDDPTGSPFTLIIEEHAPGSVVSTSTAIRSQPADPERTKIVVHSNKTGLSFDSRERHLEKQRLKELLAILQIKK